MTQAILSFLKAAPEPSPDAIYGDGSRCRAYLVDGTLVPCVMLRRAAPLTALALRRFEEERKGKGIFRDNKGYEKIVASFVTAGNRLNSYDIAKVEPSRFCNTLGPPSEDRG